MGLKEFLTIGRIKLMAEKRQLIGEVMPSSVVKSLESEGYPTETEIGGTAGNGVLYTYMVKDDEYTEEEVMTIDEYIEKMEEDGRLTVIGLAESKIFYPEEMLPDVPITRAGVGIRFPGIRRLTSTAKAYNQGVRFVPPPEEVTFEIKSIQHIKGRFRTSDLDFAHEEEKSIDTFLLPFNDSFMTVEVHEEPFLKESDIGIVTSLLWISKLSTV